MIKSILVFIEQRDNQIKKSSLEALSHAVKLASVTAAKTTALIAGGEFESFDRVSSTGVNQIIHFQNPDLNIYSPSAFAKLLADTAKENGSDCLLFANSQMGKDLAPRVAARLDAGIAMDCINLDYQDTELVVNRPIFAGKAYQLPDPAGRLPAQHPAALRGLADDHAHRRRALHGHGAAQQVGARRLARERTGAGALTRWLRP